MLFNHSLDWLVDETQDWPPPQTDKQNAAEIVQAALARAGLSGELTADEQRLLSAWRSLIERQQIEILGYISGLAASTTADAEDLARRLAPDLAKAEAGQRQAGRQRPAGDQAG